jgi:hypothetical protein
MKCIYCGKPLTSDEDRHWGVHQDCWKQQQNLARQAERVERAIRKIEERCPFGCD